MSNKNLSLVDYSEITVSASITLRSHGWRAKCLQRLIRLDLPVPRTVALSFDAVRAIAAAGRRPDLRALITRFDPTQLLSVRPSAGNPDWGGPGAILNIGMNDARHAQIPMNSANPPPPRSIWPLSSPTPSMSRGWIRTCLPRPNPACRPCRRRCATMK